MKFCKDCWNEGRCKAEGRTVDFAVDDGVCIDFDECKPMTNADRIRAMSDEELAETLIRYNDLCDMFMADDGMKYYDFEAAKEAEMEWLQQPAEGE